MPSNGNSGDRQFLQTRGRGPVTDRALAKGNDLHHANFTRTIFDNQPLAEFAGYAVLGWCEDVASDGTMLGVALVRLPNIADVDLVVEFHSDGGRLWTEGVPDTPRRCRRRLERALPILCQLIARAIGGDAIARMLRQREADDPS